jgi:hypothetical protein
MEREDWGRGEDGEAAPSVFLATEDSSSNHLSCGMLKSLIIAKTLIRRSVCVHAASTTVLFYVHASYEVVALSPLQSNCMR